MREGLELPQIEEVYRRVASRYDWQHGLLTAWSDQRGRKLLVDQAVRAGDRVLDCGAGTGATGLLAAGKVGPGGSVIFFDISDAMLEEARTKVARGAVGCPVEFRTGNMERLPFEDGAFDVVLSTYSLCPVLDPARSALELYRVTRPGGQLGLAHSAEPSNPVVRTVADWVERVAWRFPSLSLGCRSVDVRPALERAGGETVLHRRIGVPLWPFLVLVVRKPERGASL